MKNQEVEGLLSMNESERILRRAEYHLGELGGIILQLHTKYASLRWQKIEERLLEEAAKKYGITEDEYDISIRLDHMQCNVRIQKKEPKEWTFESDSITFHTQYGTPFVMSGTATVRFTL